MTWNQHEVSILMGLLKKLVALWLWKTENGFRPDYLQKLEEKMREKLSGIDMRASPHINSQITIWKRHHGSLQIALSDTGSGFNHITKVIDVSDIAWAKAVKELTLVGMSYKLWSFHDDWFEVFGNDKSNGVASENVIDVVYNLVSEDAQPHVAENAPGESHVNLDGIDACEMDVESTAPTVETVK
ncbi:hypothetical protein ACS0TY_020604 [Phlomoides rotata]